MGLRARFSFDETMDFGEDTGTPVLETSAARVPVKFTGRPDKLVIRLGDARVSSLDQRPLDAGAKRAAAARY